MRILHIIRSVDPKGGGPIEGVCQLAKAFSSMGHTIEILSLDGKEDDCVKSSSILVHAVGPGRANFGFSNKFKFWLELNYKNYDIFIVEGIWQYHSFAAHKVLKRINVPYFIFTHGMLDPWFKYQYPLKHLKKCLYWLWGEYPVLRDAKKVLFTCEEEKILARQSFWPSRWNEQVVNYGTSGHEGDAEQQRQLFIRHFPHIQDKRCLLFLSRIHPKKGVDILIEAFAKAAQLEPDLHLIIAGPDQVGWQGDLEKLAEKLGITDKITWTGMLTSDMKWGAYLCSEAFILPSHQENFGIVVAEALSCGKPVLISNKVNIWREIEQDNAGLVEDDNLAGCIGLIERWLALNYQGRFEICLNALKCFKGNFEINNAAISLIKTFNN